MTTALRETLVFRPRFIEGSYNPKTRTVDVTIISEGLGNKRDKHFYSNEVLQRAVSERVFEGAQAYADHPSKFDDSNRPERSIRDLVGYYHNVNLTTIRDPDTGRSVEAIAAKFKIQEGCEWVDGLIRESIAYSQKFPQKTYTGISINADGDAEPMTINGQEVKAVTHISEVISADVVTRPARGGGFLKFTESARGAFTRRQKMLKNVSSVEKELRKIVESKATEIEPKKLLALADQLREAGGAKCAECGHMHEGKDCETCAGNDKECSEEDFKAAKKEAKGPNAGEEAPDMDDAKESKDGKDDGDDDGEDDGDDDEEPKGKSKKESTDTGDGKDGDKLVAGRRKESLSIEDLKKRHPSFWAAALKEARASIGKQLDDKDEEIAQLKASIALNESRVLAEKKLAEANFPPGAADRMLIQLIGLGSQEMDQVIKAETTFLESLGFNAKSGKFIEGAGPRSKTQPISVRESDITTRTNALAAGIREVA